MSTDKVAIVIILDQGTPDDPKSTGFNSKALDSTKKMIEEMIFFTHETGLAFIPVRPKKELVPQTRFISYSFEAPTWALYRDLENVIKRRKSADDWLKAIQMATDMISYVTERKAFIHFKILLFTRCIAKVNTDNLELVKKKLLDNHVQVISVRESYDIMSNQDDSGLWDIVRNESALARNIEAENSVEELKRTEENMCQDILADIITSTNGDTCDLENVQDYIGIDKMDKSINWSVILQFGDEFIDVDVLTWIKEEEFPLPIKYEYNDRPVVKLYEYTHGGNTKNDLIGGYVVGATPVPYPPCKDECNNNKATGIEKYIKCIGFTYKHKVPPKMLHGKGTSIVVCQQNEDNYSSQVFFSMIVMAMIKSQLVMLARRISKKGKKSKAVVLLPYADTIVPCMRMIELSFSHLVHNYIFPALRTTQIPITEDQMLAVSDMVDAMTLESIKGQESFPFRFLPNPLVDFSYRSVTNRALQINAFEDSSNISSRFEMSAEIKSKSAVAVSQVMQLFEFNVKEVPDSIEPSTNSGDPQFAR